MNNSSDPAEKPSQKLHPANPDEFWKLIFNAIPLPMFIVDDDVAIEEFNDAAGSFCAESRSNILRHRGGDILHCVQAMESANGCGTGPKCKDCLIRNSVKEAFQEKVTRRATTKMELQNKDGVFTIQLQITATPLPFQDRRLMLLILENLTELLALRKLLPVCAHCKKIRDDDQYWHAIDTYFAENMDVNFSHGICPDCMKTMLKDFDARA